MRADGYKIKHADAMYTVAAHFMKYRYDAMNMITLDVPLDPIKQYLNKARKEGHATSHLAVILAAYVRTISKYPMLNRFVVNKRFYAHKKIEVGMVVLKQGSGSHGTMSKVEFMPDDTIADVDRRIKEYVAQNSAPDDETNSTDKVINTLLSLPGLCRMGVPILVWLDKHGLLPKKILDMSPFHTSLVISDLASIRTNSIYHHVYDFGTTSMVLTMGNPHEVPVRRGKEIEFVRCMSIGLVMDERIASGAYFAIAFREFQRYCNDPSLLEQKPAKEDIVADPGI